jgi:antitoxin component of RelBE/YafQ-DinJ toxin-antitoxin module
MKKTVIFVLVLALTGGAAFAQGSLLKGIGDKAKQAASQQLKKNIGNALGLGGGDSTQQQSADDYVSTATSSMTYAQDLLDPNGNNDFFPSEEVKASHSFNTYQDALKARLDLPKPGSLSSEKELRAYAAKVAEIKQATVDMCMKYTRQQTDLNNAVMNNPHAGGNSPVSTASIITPEEIMKAISDAGLNPATASEAQVQDVVADHVAKKMGITKAQAVEMMSKASADEKGNRMKQIETELAGIYEAKVMNALNSTQTALSNLGASLLGGKTSVDETTLSGALFTLRQRIVSSWAKSDEAKAINKLEREQGIKGRAKQNEIIDKWNSRQLDTWVAKIAKFDEAESADALKVAALDAELEAMSAADKKTSDWAAAKLQAVMLNGLVISAMESPSKVFDCPLVSHVSTSSDDY